jgi:hypothetical protein
MPETNSSSRKIDPSIVAALIGVVGTIVVTLITLNAQRNSIPTPASPVVVEITSTSAPTPLPTDTVPPGADTSTPAPTDTPAPTSTSTDTPIPILAAGDDWKAGCVSTVWQAYPSSTQPGDKDGCLFTPFNRFFTTNDGLAFIYDDTVSTAEIYGIFTKLPSSGTAGLNMTLDTSIALVNGDILIGVFSAPDVNSDGALITIPQTNSPDRAKITFRDMPGFKDFSQSSGPVASLNGTYSILFDFNGGEVEAYVQQKQINLGSIPVVSAEKWLFIGYRVLLGWNQLKAEFSDLTITR